MNTRTTTPTPTATLSATASTPDAIAVAETLMTLANATLSPQQVGGAWFATVPPGHQHVNISKAVEAAQARPDRKTGTVELRSLDSLVQICQDQQAQTHAYIYADPDARTITAVFNDQRDTQGWRDHRANFKAEYTLEFQRWLSKNGHECAMDQLLFAEFIEDNFADITEPSAHQLLEVATTLQAKTEINFRSAKRLQDGQNQITYTEAINATAGASGALTIPKEFALGLRIFKNGEGYKLRARLKYRLAGGGVKFWYELDRPVRAIEDAFASYIEKVRTETGYTVLVGKA